jgi:5-methylcytosine-specific restriction endonuclease McrA
MPKDELIALVTRSKSYVQILDAFDLQNKGANYKTLQRRLREENISFDHIVANNGKEKRIGPRVSTQTILVEHSGFNRNHLKIRLLDEGLLRNQCYECGQLPTWNGKALVLQLDHINGVSDDHRLDNLRILCPHCHSQTSTFAGRQNRKPKPKKVSELNPEWRREPRLATRKVERPHKEELEKLVWEMPTMQLAKRFGVSDVALAKWCKHYGISKPPRGYWMKQKAA